MNEKMNRTKNTKRNIIASYIVMVLKEIFQFILRTAIVTTLGQEYLGLSSVYTSIIGVLNIAELGFTTSVIFFLYKPLAEDDTDRVCKLLAYLKKVYFYVGLVILVGGLLITPGVQFLVRKDLPQDVNAIVLYYLYLLNTVAGYFLYAHKTALITAIQRLDLTMIANGICILLQYGLQLIALFLFKNYYLYIIAMVLCTITTNVFTAFISKKYFPQYQCHGEIDFNSKKEIAVKVKGMMICNISGVTYTSLDSIIITLLDGLTLVAIYNNYITIFNVVTAFVMVIRSAMQASVGNSVASESVEKNYNDIKVWQLGFTIIGTFCMSCMICLFQPFMTVWMGGDSLLPMFNVILIGAWFMVSVTQNAFYLYLMGDGLFSETKWAYVFSTCFNLTANLILGKIMGITGIILSSLLSCLISGTFWQCCLIFKHYFKKSAKKYIATQFVYFGIAAIVAIISFYVCRLIIFEGVIGLILKTIVCVIVTIILIYIFYNKNSNFPRIIELITQMIAEGRTRGNQLYEQNVYDDAQNI